MLLGVAYNELMLTDSQIIDQLGGTYAVARMFSIKPPSVSAWRVDGIPQARRMYLALVRPDLFPNGEKSHAEPPPPSRPRPLPTLNGQGATPTAEPATTAARAQTAACGVSAGSEHTEQEAASCRG